MNIVKRVVCVLVCVVLLCSCSQKQPETDDAGQSVTIQTFGTVITSETPPATTSETLNTDRFTMPESTGSSSRTPPSTSATTTGSSKVTTAAPERDDKPSSADDGYEITPANTVMYATASVNVRVEPDADSDRVGHLEKNERVTVTGLVSNGWVRISFKDGEYFVNGSYLKEADSPVSEASTAVSERDDPPASTSNATESVDESSDTETQGDGYTITDAEGTMRVTDSLNVREEPDASSRKVGQLSAGDIVTVTGIVSNGWVRIIYEREERYVSGEYLAIIPDEPGQNTQPTVQPGLLSGTNSYSALNYDEQKAVWFAYLDIDEMLRNAGKTQFTASVGDAFDKVVSLGCNTVYVHVRSFGDAYYYSDYYPFTAAYSDQIGVRPSYDPLEIMIEEAHDRGLSFHAWINPMRTTTRQRLREMSSDYLLKQWYDSDTANGTFLVYDSGTGYYWLSPAYTAVRKLICSGVAEIVLNYDVDAVHIDDYFYPTTSASFDKAAFEASMAFNRASWRREIVSTLVKEIYSTVKSCNSSVLFGVSPQGNIENNRDNLYADIETWCSQSGYLDYIVPQIYYGFRDKLSFNDAAAQWSDIVKLNDIKLVCGIAAYKVGVNSEWSSGSILSLQTNYIAALPSFDGVAYYRYGSLFGSASSSEKLMRTELSSLVQAIASF